MEDQLVAEDAETHPPTLDALLDDKGSISSGDLTYGKMAERISPEAKKAWDEKYGLKLTLIPIGKTMFHPKLSS